MKGNIVALLHCKNEKSDKIYGIISGAGLYFSFYGKANPPENEKEKSNLTVNLVVPPEDNSPNYQYFYDNTVRDIILSKRQKGYKVIYANADVGYFVTGGNVRFDNPEDAIDSVFYNFEENIKKKLAVKILRGNKVISK